MRLLVVKRMPTQWLNGLTKRDHPRRFMANVLPAADVRL
jgi:hypothetical protein